MSLPSDSWSFGEDVPGTPENLRESCEQIRQGVNDLWAAFGRGDTAGASTVLGHLKSANPTALRHLGFAGLDLTQESLQAGEYATSPSSGKLLIRLWTSSTPVSLVSIVALVVVVVGHDGALHDDVGRQLMRSKEVHRTTRSGARRTVQIASTFEPKRRRRAL